MAGRTGKHKHKTFPASNFTVAAGRLWQLPARIRKQCCYSCETDSFLMSISLIPCEFWAIASILSFNVKMKFLRFCEKKPQTRAALISWLNFLRSKSEQTRLRRPFLGCAVDLDLLFCAGFDLKYGGFVSIP